MSFDENAALSPAAPVQYKPAHAKRSRRAPLLLAAVAIAVSGTAIGSATAYATNATDTAPAAVSVTGWGTERAPIGEVIGTGIQVPGGEQVFYLLPVQIPYIPDVHFDIPDVHFGVMLGVRDTAGNLTDQVMIGETMGSDRSAGFHALEGTFDNVPITVFGYYAGPADRITATVDGKQIQAHQARWSEDQNITVFWFSRDAVRHDRDVQDLVAYDADGRSLPAGNTTIYHG